MSCTSSCPTQDHESWGACVRAKNLGVKQGESTKADYGYTVVDKRVTAHEDRSSDPRFANCTSGCKVGGHASTGECLKAKHVTVNGMESIDPTFTREREKDWNSELDLYASARAQGIQPDTTKRKDIEAAIEFSNMTGQAYNAENPPKIVVEG